MGSNEISAPGLAIGMGSPSYPSILAGITGFASAHLSPLSRCQVLGFGISTAQLSRWSRSPPSKSMGRRVHLTRDKCVGLRVYITPSPHSLTHSLSFLLAVNSSSYFLRTILLIFNGTGTVFQVFFQSTKYFTITPNCLSSIHNVLNLDLGCALRIAHHLANSHRGVGITYQYYHRKHRCTTRDKRRSRLEYRCYPGWSQWQ